MSTNANVNTFPHPFTFLIVDDHEFMQHLIMEFLNSANAGKIEKASNGKLALDVLKKMRKVDFIITDFNMPTMNGLELLKAVRAGNANVPRETPVIMLSGFNDDSLLVAAMELDANGFIEKPVSKVALVSRMNKIFMDTPNVQEAEVYEKIRLPNIDGGLGDIPSNDTDDFSVPDEIKANGISTLLEDVPKGSLIVKDVLTVNGIVLINEGSQATTKLLDFLIQTKEVTGIKEIFICHI